MTSLGKLRLPCHGMGMAEVPSNFTLQPGAVAPDFELPDGNGMDLAKELREADPDVRVMLITGYADRHWEEIKRRERREDDPGPRVPRSLPALKRAAELTKALGRGDGASTEASWREEPDEDPNLVGPLLLAVVQVAVRLGLDPELELRDALERKLQDP